MIKRFLLSASLSLTGMRWPFGFREDESVDSPVAVTEVLSLFPGDVESYHLPLTRGVALNIELMADAPLQLRILDEDTWRAARTVDARLRVCCCHAADGGRNVQMRFIAPKTDGYMLLVSNPGAATINALLALRSELSQRISAAVESTAMPNDESRTRPGRMWL